MASITAWTGMLFVLLTVLTAVTLSNATTGEVGLSHTSNVTSNKSRKRQEIIFLKDDVTNKRNREGETIANIEKHGESLSAEGNNFKGAPRGNNYDDLSDQGPALKEQSVSKDKGPPEIQENEKKSDAYEVISDGHDNNHATLPTATDDETLRVVKVGRHKGRHGFRMHPSDTSDSFTGHHRSGLHIVSLDGDDTDENAFGNKDTEIYGSIGSPVTNPVRQKSDFRPRERESYFRNDYIPPNVISVSQDELTGGLSQRDQDQTRNEMFPIFRRRDPFLFSQSSQLTQPEELMQPFRPVNPKSISVGGKPNMFYFPLYNGRADSNPSVLPMTAQNAFPASQLGAAPMEYSSPLPTGTLNNRLLFQPALQVPVLQTQSVNYNPSYVMPLQPDSQFMFGNQQPDVRSLYQLQSQPQMQIPQVPMSQLTQPQPLMMPAQMQMTPELLSSANQRVIGPSNRWVDEDGRQRSEVLDLQRDRHDEDRPQDERGEEDEGYEEGGHESSRYYHRDDDSPREDENPEEDETAPYQPERSYSRDEETPAEGDSEDVDEPEESRDEDDMDRSYDRNDPATQDEETPDPRSPDENNSDDQEVSAAQDRFATQRSLQQFNRQVMQQYMTPITPPFNFPRFPMASNQMDAQTFANYQLNSPSPSPFPSPSSHLDAQTFARYQLTSPSSALDEHILPKTQEPKTPPHVPGDPNVQISHMSPAEAEYMENKATLEPNFTPPIASKDNIPGKSRRFRFGLGNVLIRLNGKPLEDSSQLRSKIINGQIVQGKGKLIKSKGPVRVKLSHTKDTKHLKIIDIIARKQFHVYDTKSKIRRPSNVTIGRNKNNSTMASFFANKRLQKALDNMT